jgi:hypothetical protein
MPNVLVHELRMPSNCRCASQGQIASRRSPAALQLIITCLALPILIDFDQSNIHQLSHRPRKSSCEIRVSQLVWRRAEPMSLPLHANHRLDRHQHGRYYFLHWSQPLHFGIEKIRWYIVVYDDFVRE